MKQQLTEEVEEYIRRQYTRMSGGLTMTGFIKKVARRFNVLNKTAGQWVYKTVFAHVRAYQKIKP